jgi:hypothetical protein
MPGIMADNDIQGQFIILLNLLRARTWEKILEDLGFSVQTFESVGLERTAPDVLVWQTCQARQILLIMGNRNQEGPDSLEAAIREFNQADSLPVITIGDTRRFVRSRDYAERAVNKLLDYLQNLDNYRGAGRLYVP